MFSPTALALLFFFTFASLSYAQGFNNLDLDSEQLALLARSDDAADLEAAFALYGRDAYPEPEPDPEPEWDWDWQSLLAREELDSIYPRSASPQGPFALNGPSSLPVSGSPHSRKTPKFQRQQAFQHSASHPAGHALEGGGSSSPFPAGLAGSARSRLQKLKPLRAIQDPEPSPGGSGAAVDGELKCSSGYATRRCLEHVKCVKGQMEMRTTRFGVVDFDRCTDICKCEMGKEGG